MPILFYNPCCLLSCWFETFLFLACFLSVYSLCTQAYVYLLIPCWEKYQDTLEVFLFTRMPLEVPNLPNYPYVQKNTLYKVIHSNLQALFTRIPNLNLFTIMPLYTYFDKFIPLLFFKIHHKSNQIIKIILIIKNSN